MVVDVDGAVGGVVDPEAEHAAALGGDLEDADEAAADGGRRGLGNVDGDGERGGADAKARDGAAGVDHVERAAGGGHEGAAEEEDGAGEHDGFAAAEFLGDGECEEGAEEAAGLGVAISLRSSG